MKVLYRLHDRLSLYSFSSAVYNEDSQILRLHSSSFNLAFEIPRASAVLALTKLMADGYCDLQSFPCDHYLYYKN